MQHKCYIKGDTLCYPALNVNSASEVPAYEGPLQRKVWNNDECAQLANVFAL